MFGGVGRGPVGDVVPVIGAGLSDGGPAGLRGAAQTLRRVAAESLLLLAPVLALDGPRSWRSPWQRRCHQRIRDWVSALVAGARRAREQADALDRAAAGPERRRVEPAGQVGVGNPWRDDASSGGVGDAEVIFAPELLAELARRLRVAGQHATRLVAELGSVGRSAGACLGLDLVRLEAGPMAEAIDLRMARFAAGEVISFDSPWGGVGASPAPRNTARSGAADPAAVAAELAAVIGTSPLRLGVRDLGEIATRFARLDPATQQAVVGRLRGRPLAVLAAAVAMAPTRVDLGTLGLLPAVIRLADLILRRAPPSMVGEIVRAFPELEPATSGPSWSSFPGPGGLLSGAGLTLRDHTRDPVWVRGATPSDVGQGRLGDCFFLVALIGIARADPGALRRGLSENPNGTVTVSFHGMAGAAGPVEVTVTRDLPTRAGTGEEIGADANNLDGDPELWPALYEKAYARLVGGYAGLEGGDPATAMRQLTGIEAARQAASRTTVADIAARLDAGDVVAVLTRSRTGRESGLVPGHAYAVLGADVGTGRVLVRNPWDQTATDDGLDWRRWEELTPELTAVHCGPTGRSD